VSNSTPVIAGLNDGSLRESATKSNTSSAGRPIRISPSILAIWHLQQERFSMRAQAVGRR
jgi:hypothetical protein